MPDFRYLGPFRPLWPMSAAIPHTKLNASAIIVEYSNPSTAKSGLESPITAVAMTEIIAARITIDTKIHYIFSGFSEHEGHFFRNFA